MSQMELDERRRRKLASPEMRAAFSRAKEELVERFGAREMARVAECITIACGDRAPVLSHPLHRPALIHFPGVTSKPWYEPGEYAATARIARVLAERSTEIRTEVASLREGWVEYLADFYMRQKFYTVQGAEWSSLELFHEGERADWVPRLCPVLDAAIREIEPLVSGSVMLSRLAPGAALPPHFDDNSYKLTIHFGIEVPERCGIRVGGEERTWRTGECLVFGDTFLHEVWNHGESDRVCLLIDIWHPELAPAEVEAMRVVRRLAAPACQPAVFEEF